MHHEVRYTHALTPMVNASTHSFPLGWVVPPTPLALGESPTRVPICPLAHWLWSPPAACPLCALPRPDLVDFSKLTKSNANYNLQRAFRTAEQHLGLARLLDPEGEPCMAQPRLRLWGSQPRFHSKPNSTLPQHHPKAQGHSKPQLPPSPLPFFVFNSSSFLSPGPLPSPSPSQITTHLNFCL